MDNPAYLANNESTAPASNERHIESPKSSISSLDSKEVNTESKRRSAFSIQSFLAGIRIPTTYIDSNFPIPKDSSKMQVEDCRASQPDNLKVSSNSPAFSNSSPVNSLENMVLNFDFNNSNNPVHTSEILNQHPVGNPSTVRAPQNPPNVIHENQSVASVEDISSPMPTLSPAVTPSLQPQPTMLDLSQQQLADFVAAQYQQLVQQIQPVFTQMPFTFTTQHIQQAIFNLSNFNLHYHFQQLNAVAIAQMYNFLNSTNGIPYLNAYQNSNQFQTSTLDPNFAKKNNSSDNVLTRVAQKPPKLTKMLPQRNEQDSPDELPSDPDQRQILSCEWFNCRRKFYTNHVYFEHVGWHVRAQERNVCLWRNCERGYKPFSAHYMLNLHVYKHTGQKPQKCLLCEKRYSRTENLKAHLRTHSGERPYKCALCPKAFTNSSDRAKHQKRIHTDEKPYKCPVQDCEKCYTDPSSLRKHIQIQHGDDVYRIAKENKTKNGRGGNYGFIPASHIDNHQQYHNLADMPSTSRAYYSMLGSYAAFSAESSLCCSPSSNKRSGQQNKESGSNQNEPDTSSTDLGDNE